MAKKGPDYDDDVLEYIEFAPGSQESVEDSPPLPEPADHADAVDLARQAHTYALTNFTGDQRTTKRIYDLAGDLMRRGVSEGTELSRLASGMFESNRQGARMAKVNAAALNILESPATLSRGVSWPKAILAVVAAFAVDSCSVATTEQTVPGHAADLAVWAFHEATSDGSNEADTDMPEVE